MNAALPMQAAQPTRHRPVHLRACETTHDRSLRVQALRQRVERSEYVIDPGAVADSILRRLQVPDRGIVVAAAVPTHG
jgi:anti-sigma28 factor (negative regulator of flagellin synthesis)